MRFPSSWLRDGLLVVLAAATVAGAGYVVTRDPSPPTSTVRQSLPSPTPSPSPTTPPVSALVLGPDASAETVAAGLEADLDWSTTAQVLAGSGYNTGAQTYADLVPALAAASTADVVVILSSTAASEEADPRRLGGNAQFVVAAVRDALPDSRIVLVGPTGDDPQAFTGQRTILTGVAARFGAVFVDPIGGGYTPDDLAVRLAADLRKVLPPTLVPTPSPT